MSIVIETLRNADASPFKNPFNKESLTNVFIHIRKSGYSGEVGFSATVRFENGNTKGEQKLEAEDFPGLLAQIQQFSDLL